MIKFDKLIKNLFSFLWVKVLLQKKNQKNGFYETSFAWEEKKIGEKKIRVKKP